MKGYIMKQITFSMTTMVTIEIADDRNEDAAAEQYQDMIHFCPDGLDEVGIELIETETIDCEIESSTAWDD
jgi:hypothetical protein